ncbi:MAG: hypothetical protein HRT61_05000 [Ekhidna sp.]|nr:hypothetical protein [Ekhidna sp.]
MTEINQEHIDDFHSGRMSEGQARDFNTALESDPDLQAESNFQSEVIEGVREFRKAELKSRLDAIYVGPTLLEFAQQSALVKSIGGVLVASAVGGGIYFYGEAQKELLDPKVIEITAPNQEIVSEDFIWELGVEKEEVKPVELEKIEDLRSSDSEAFVAIKQDQIIETDSESSADKVFQPSFTAPAVGNIEEENGFISTDLDELPEDAASVVSANPVNVETEYRRSLNIKYKYYDGKLFLSGDFDREQYEILEINSSSSRRIFVYYLDKYYQVGITDKLTDLPEVKDEKLLSELSAIRTNK